ncbi:HEAT repeat domain-containing protein [Mitsuaria sp. GD03876]|uniref:HEAT repeat domain-containing protein n=1 Tax=Mitsuaria sp. GD03876 TaxID=2975399 RepID=UPI002446F316|nr:HEAT repeat domain-containing protein [Mitsuaria sp. GD03876]MDH0867320.1 HEAT repeat domain-containing protein [Mitsuaria sp. GD03876]
MSTDQLLRHALRHWHADAGWRAVQELQMRGSPALLATITAMCASPRARRRAVGLSVAGQLMHHADGECAMYAEEATQQLLLHGLADPHHDVVRAAVSGLGHRPHAASVQALLRLSTSGDSQMRWQVAVALGSYEEPEAIEGLIRLSSDPSNEVRDWATFGLGTLRDDDSPEIRAALRRNLSDTDQDVRGEALVGLARRGDDGIVETLITLLTPDCHVYELDAAEALADARLVAPLQALSKTAGPSSGNAYWQARLDEALEACVTQAVPVGIQQSNAS